MITIIITAYNVGKTILKAVLSCVNLTYKDLEILIINDCSTDDTLLIILSIKDSRIRIINNLLNVGAGMSRRIGTKEAKGEYTAFLDGDDYLDESYILALHDLAIKNNADIVSSGVRIINGDSKREIKSKQFGEYNSLDFILKNKAVTSFVNNWLNNKLVRRTIWDIVDYSDRRYVEDTQTAYYVLFYANKVVDTTYVGYNYVLNSGSLIHTADDVKNKIYLALCAKDISTFVEEHKKEDYEYSVKAFLFRIHEMKSILFTDEIICKYKDLLAELFAFLLHITLV